MQTRQISNTRTYTALTFVGTFTAIVVMGVVIAVTFVR